MHLTDRETLASISENPYMQYFIGLAGFEMKQPFHHSMMTHFRRRLKDVLAEINEIVATEGAKDMKDDDDDEGNANSGGKGARKKSDPSDAAEQQTMFDEAEVQSVESAIPNPTEQASLEQTQQPMTEPPLANEPLSEERQESVTEASLPPNEGTLIADASCAPGDIAYPTDLNLLSEAREELEAIIDTLREPVVGIVTKPHKQYLAAAWIRWAKSDHLRRAGERAAAHAA